MTLHRIKICLIKSIKNYSIPIAMILFFTLDVINFWIDKKYGLNSGNSISYYGKGIFELGILGYLFTIKKYKRILLKMGVFGLLPVLWLIFYSMKPDIEINFHYVFQVIKESFKYLFPIIIFLGLKSINPNWKPILKTFELIFIFSSLIVIVSFFFDIPYFYTYNATRFGFKPPFATQNEITFFWMTGATYWANEYFQKRDYRSMAAFCVILLASILLGTKAILLFSACLGLYFILFENKNSILTNSIVVCSFLLVLVLFLYFSGAFTFFKETYDEYGFWYTITSKRNLLLDKALHLMQEWNLYNYLIGGSFRSIQVTEMDIIDLFLFAGIIGSVLYLVILRQSLFSFSLSNKIALFFVSQYILIGAVAGHVFSSGINAIYLAILFYNLQQDDSYPKNSG